MKNPVVVVGTLLLSCIVGACGKEDVKPRQQLPRVEVEQVSPRTVPVAWSFVAQTASSRQVDMLARVSGYLQRIAYKEGALVHEGQLLFQLDPKPFQAQLDGARGELLAQQARMNTARANFERVQPLARQKAASQADLDKARGEFEAANAAVAVAQARVQEAELNLGYTDIVSPVTGYTGQALQREGAYINAQTPESKLTYVAAIDPIWVTFSVSQNQWGRLQQQKARGEIVAPEQDNYVVRLLLPDGTTHPYPGHPNFADPSLSQDTGSFLVRAEVPNPDKTLRPGMFVTALLEGAVRPGTILLPRLAVQQGSKGSFVYVVRQDSVAEVRPVVLGDVHGREETIVQQGLATGDRVVVAGALKVIAGAPVQVEAAGAERPGPRSQP